jgi:hypothetical protein
VPSWLGASVRPDRPDVRHGARGCDDDSNPDSDRQSGGRTTPASSAAAATAAATDGATRSSKGLGTT